MTKKKGRESFLTEPFRGAWRADKLHQHHSSLLKGHHAQALRDDGRHLYFGTLRRTRRQRAFA